MAPKRSAEYLAVAKDIGRYREYLHCGGNGAGYFIKMVHNGIEYGVMAAYAKGMGILRHANVGATR